MVNSVREYIVRDSDGDEFLVKYISRPCGCSMNNCNSDSIEYYEPGDSIPYRQEITRGEISWLIQGLLDNEYEIEPVKK